MSRSLALSLLLVTTLGIAPAATKGHGWNGQQQITEGAGGDPCSGTICLAGDGIKCQNNTCRCGGQEGDGKLMCYADYEWRCKLISDPTCVTFSNERVDIPASCKFLMSGIRTIAVGSRGPVGECTAMILAWGVKGRKRGALGKHFIGGVEVQFTVMLSSGMFYYHSTRIFGWAAHGRYVYIEEGSTSIGASGGYGSNITTIIPGVGRIITVWDFDNNVAEIWANFCGIKVGFRAPEIFVDKIKPRFVPGVYIKVKKTHGPKFISADNSLCMAPEDEKKTIEHYIEMLKELYGKTVTKEVAMMFRILKMGPDQEFPNVPQLLKLLARTAKECDDKALLCALDACMFITTNPKFLRCWTRPGRKIRPDERYEGDGEGEGEGELEIDQDHDEEDHDEGQKVMNRALFLMHRCIESFCADSAMMCKNVKKMIKKAKCKRYAPKRVC